MVLLAAMIEFVAGVVGFARTLDLVSKEVPDWFPCFPVGQARDVDVRS